MSAACLINIQHMAQAAFRLLLPDSGTSCVSQRLADLLPLIPASPQHMANCVLNSSLNFCSQTTFFSLLQSSRVILYSPKQRHVRTDHHLFFLTDTFRFCSTLLQAGTSDAATLAPPLIHFHPNSHTVLQLPMKHA